MIELGIVQVEGLLIETPLANSWFKMPIIELALEIYISKAFTEASGLDYKEIEILNFMAIVEF